MTDAFATANGYELTKCELRVPWAGMWWADVWLADSVELSGVVTLRLGNLTAVGTVDPRYSGTFGASRAARIVAGAGAWGALLASRSYHSDGGVSASLVASDAARECGETMGDCAPAVARLGSDWERESGPASQALELAAGGAAWWVGLDGVTRVGSRPTAEADPEKYSLLTFSPTSQSAVLSVDDPSDIGVGSIISDRLEAPATVREVSYTVDAAAFRVTCWLGGTGASEGRLRDAARGLVEALTRGKLWGLYAYRVVSMVSRRVNLQAVSRAVGLPDMVAVSQRPGIPGAWAELTPGVVVLVAFVAGSPAEPVIVGYSPNGDPAAVPVSLELCGTRPAARVGDTITVFFPATMAVSGVITIGGTPSPFVGTMVLTSGVPGIIGSGSGIVGIG